MTNPDTDTLKALLADFHVQGETIAARSKRHHAYGALSSASPTLAAETISLRERVKELEGVLGPVVDIAGRYLSQQDWPWEPDVKSVSAANRALKRETK